MTMGGPQPSAAKWVPLLGSLRVRGAGGSSRLWGAEEGSCASAALAMGGLG